MDYIQNLFSKLENKIDCDQCNSQKDMKNRRIIELSRGRSLEIDDYDANAIKTSKYSIINFFPKTLCNLFFFRFGNFFFLIISIIMLSNESLNPFNRWMTVIPLAVFSVIYMLKELILDIRRSKNDQVQNDQIFPRKCIVDKRDIIKDNKFQVVKQRELKPGDMIWLEQGDTVPADIIFLDSNEIRDREAICFIDTYNVNGIKEKVRKRAVQQTTIQSKDHPQKMDFQERRKTLSGKVEFENPNSNIDAFNGFFRKKTDTRTELLTNYNFIPRGSIIRTQTSSGWVLGFIVYSGMDTKIMQNSNYQKVKTSHLEKIIQSFFFYTLVVVGIISLVSIIVLIAKSKDFQYLKDIDEDISSGIKIFKYLVLYSQLIPLSIYGYIDIVQIFSIFKLQNIMKQSLTGSNGQQKEMLINNPNCISNLGHIDYLIVDNSLCTGEYVIDNVLINRQLYKWKWKDCREKLEGVQQNFLKSPKNDENNLLASDSISSQALEQIPELSKNQSQELQQLQSPGRLYMNGITERGEQATLDIEVENKDEKMRIPMFQQFNKPLQKYPEQNANNQILTDNIILEENEQEIDQDLSIKNQEEDGNLISFQKKDVGSAQKEPKEPEPESHNQQEIKDKKYKKGDKKNKKNSEKVKRRKHSLPQTQLTGIDLDQKGKDITQFIDTLTKISDGRMKDNSEEFYIHSLMHGVMLCHEAVEMSIQEKQREYWSVTKEEEEVLRFAYLCGYQFLSRPIFKQFLPHYTCNVRGTKKSYRVLGLNSSTENKKTVSVIVQQEITDKKQNSSPYIMYCKGDIHYMSKPKILKMNVQERATLNDIKQDFEKHSIRPLLYGYKELTQQEADEYHKEFLRLKNHPNNQHNELEALSLKMETGFHILGVIGLKDELMVGAKEFVKFTKKANINTWMLTGDSGFKTIKTAQNLQIIDNIEKKPFEIEAEDKDDIHDQIKKILAEMRDNISPEIEQDYENVQSNLPRKGSLHAQSPKTTKNQNQSPTFKYDGQVNNSDDEILQPLQNVRSLKIQKFEDDQNQFGQNKMEDCLNTFKWSLKLNGKSFKIIQQDQYLLQHFLFIISFCKHIVAYRLSPSQKAYIVKLAKQNFMFNPTISTIGDGFNDTLMMQESDISFELKKNWESCTLNEKDEIQKTSSKEVLINAGDIVVESLDQIHIIILEQGLQLFSRFENIVFYLFYQQILLGFVMFYFNWYSLFTGTSIFEPGLVFLYNFAFNISNYIALGLFDSPVSSIIMQNLPALYINGQKEKNSLFVNFLLKVVLQGIVHGLLVFYITVYAVGHSVQGDGFSTDNGVVQLVLFFSVMLIFNFKILISLLSRGSKAGLISVPISFLLVFFYVYFNNNDGSNKIFNNFDTVEHCRLIFTDLENILILIFNLLCCLGISYIIQGIICYYLNPNVIQKWQQQYLVFRNIKQILRQNTIILKQSYTRYLNIGQLVKKFFKQSQGIDTSIQDMLHAGDINLAEMKLNKYTLKMENNRLQRQYQGHHLGESIRQFQIIATISLFIFGIWEALNYFTEDNQENLYSNEIEREQIFYSRIGFFVFFILCIVWTFSMTFQYNYYQQAPVILLIGVIAEIIYCWLTEDMRTSLASAFVTVITTFNFNLSLINTIFINVLNSLNFLVRILFLYYYKNWDEENNQPDDLVKFYSAASFFILLAFISVYSVILIYRTDKQKRSDYIAKDQIKQEKAKTNEISSILLPKFVSDIIQSGNLNMDDASPDVGILFCYIKEFADINRYEKLKVVSHLDEMFRKFDELCVQFGVQKYETQGPSYLAVAGIKQCEVDIPDKVKRQNKCVRLISMAFAMQEVAKGMKYGPDNRPFGIKIGINSGEVIAGIIGFHKKQFCLVGDTVNIAQRTTSKGQGDINIKENVYEEVKHFNLGWYFDKRLVEMQGVEGKVGVYIVDNKPNQKMLKASNNFNKIIDAYKQLKEKNEVPKELLKGPNHIRMTNKNAIGFRINAQQIEYYKKLQEEEELKKEQEKAIQKIQPKKTFKTMQSVAHKKINVSSKMSENIDPNASEDELQIINDNTLIKLETSPLLTFKRPSDVDPGYYNDLIKEFNYWLKDLSLSEGKTMLLLLILVYLILTLFLITVKDYVDDGDLKIYWFRAAFVVLQILCITTYQNAFTNRNYKLLCFITFIYSSFPSILQAYYAKPEDQSVKQDVETYFPTIQLLEQTLIFITASNLAVFSFIYIVFIVIVQNIVFFIFYGMSEWLSLDFLVFWIGLNIFVLMKNYHQISQNIETYNTLRKKDLIRKEQDKYVSQLMPQHIILRMKNINSLAENKMAKVDMFEKVSVLQADIKGFTAYSNEQKDPRKCVELLQKLYVGFDKLCIKYNVFKLYTVGDCYVVLGFTNSNKRGPETYQKEAYNLTLMGLEMLQVIADVRREVNFDALGMRVGIHTGTIVGGIIGTEVVRYDIYGKDAYITTLMESEGFEEIYDQNKKPFKKVNQLHISQVTKNLLEKGGRIKCFDFREHRDIDGNENLIDISKYTKNEPDEEQTMKGYFVTLKNQKPQL